MKTLDDQNGETLKKAELSPERVRELLEEAGKVLELLREAADALVPYMRIVPGTNVLNRASQVHDRIQSALAALPAPQPGVREVREDVQYWLDAPPTSNSDRYAFEQAVRRLLAQAPVQAEGGEN